MAKGFKIIGFSNTSENKIKKKIGINLKTYTLKTNRNNKIRLTDSRINSFEKQLKTKYENLQENVKAIAIDNIKFHVKMWSYKGYRHNYKFPVRGQRTHTNRKTAKKLNIYGYDN